MAEAEYKYKNDVRVESWEHLNQELFPITPNKFGRFRTDYVFRGLANSAWKLETSLQRLQHAPGETKKLEPVILRSFKKYAHQDANPGGSIWNLLALGQHHGLPTRVLDWTNSPFIAVHFATFETDKYTTDGAIWCVDQGKLRDYLPRKFHDILNKHYAYLFSVDMLEEAADNLEKFDDFQNDIDPFVVFFEPPSIDDRIINQYAVLSVMSDPTETFSEWLKSKQDCLKRIIIPKELKWQIRDKLDQMNISERMLFPGLDGLSQWLKRYYSPKK